MQPHPQNTFTPQLQTYCDSVINEFDNIPAERKETLNSISQYIATQLKQNKSSNLTFICVHNARRSHFGQVWANTAAQYYGIEGIKTFSGGVEVTECNPRTVESLKRTGFIITTETKGINPHYTAKACNDCETNHLYSKLYNSLENPRANFAAIMVCGEGDEACPLVAGADERILIPYTDPKKADGTPAEAETYDQRSRQIAREMFYVMAHVK